jgi:hypothetical protein
VRLGIYNNDSTTGKPSTVVLDAGTVSCTAASTTYAITISQSLSEGWYWLAFCTQGAASTNTFIGAATAFGLQNVRVQSSFSNPVTSGAFTESSVSGAFATAGSLAQASQPVLTFLRAT